MGSTNMRSNDSNYHETKILPVIKATSPAFRKALPIRSSDWFVQPEPGQHSASRPPESGSASYDYSGFDLSADDEPDFDFDSGALDDYGG